MSDDLVKRLERWRHVDNAASNIIREAVTRITALEAENKRLREALEPFRRGAIALPRDAGRKAPIRFYNYDICTADDFRRAAAALEKK